PADLPGPMGPAGGGADAQRSACPRRPVRCRAMSDMYELLVSADLPGDLAGAEAGELRWHLGLGPRPERRVIVGEFPEAGIGDDGRPRQDGRGGGLAEGRRRALPAQRGTAHRIGGALMAAMDRRPGGEAGPARPARRSTPTTATCSTSSCSGCARAP